MNDLPAASDMCVRSELRLQLIGYMSSVLFHDMSNILTVLGGLRRSWGADLSSAQAESYARMIDDQISRSESLARIFQSIRRPSETTKSLKGCLAAVGEILSLKAQGRRIEINQIGDVDLKFEAQEGHELCLALLGGLMPSFAPICEQRAPALVELEAKLEPGSELEPAGQIILEVRLRLNAPLQEVDPLEVEPSQAMSFVLGRRLAVEKGGSIEIDGDELSKRLILTWTGIR